MSAIADRLAIMELAANYMRALDRLDCELMEAQFWADAHLAYGIFEGGARDFAAFCMDALAGHDRNHHMLGQHLIEIDGDEAYGEVYYQAYHRTTDEHGAKRDLVIAGRYLERCERRGGIWKYAYRSEIVDWARDDPASDAILGAAPFIVGQRKPADPLYHRAAMRRPG
ncbi:MAG: nuclear transport factor 2 family protein [Erythrobacter sp.]